MLVVAKTVKKPSLIVTIFSLFQGRSRRNGVTDDDECRGTFAYGRFPAVQTDALFGGELMKN